MMPTEITWIDRIMLRIANDIAKENGLPEFYAPHIYTTPEQERAMVEAVSKRFTMEFDGDGCRLIPLPIR